MCGGNVAGGVDVSCSGLACVVPGELCSTVLSGVVFSDSGTWIPDVLSLKAGTVKHLGPVSYTHLTLPTNHRV